MINIIFIYFPVNTRLRWWRLHGPSTERLLLSGRGPGIPREEEEWGRQGNEPLQGQARLLSTLIDPQDRRPGGEGADLRHRVQMDPHSRRHRYAG